MATPEMPRLAMDERMLLDAQTGVATYARGLRAAQFAIVSDALFFGDRKDPQKLPSAPFSRAGRWLRALKPGERLSRTDGNRLIVPDLFRLAQVHFDVWRRPLRVRASGSAGIVHWSYPLPIEVMGWRNIYTVHDAIPLTAPELTSINAARHRRLLVSLAQNAAAFVTVSDAAHAEIRGAISGHLPPVVNCGQAVTVMHSTDALLPEGLSPRNYWLIVGAVETRKNIPSIIEAHRRSGSDLPLVIAGPDGWGGDAISSLLARDPIIRLLYLPIDKLHTLIAQARALLMVSLAEGFGLPIAEAMALGTPVITSREGAQAETAAQAALLVNPLDPDDIAAAMRQLSTESPLWHELIQRGAARARAFSQVNFTNRLRALYNQITREEEISL